MEPGNNGGFELRRIKPSAEVEPVELRRVVPETSKPSLNFDLCTPEGVLSPTELAARAQDLGKIAERRHTRIEHVVLTI